MIAMPSRCAGFAFAFALALAACSGDDDAAEPGEEPTAEPAEAEPAPDRDAESPTDAAGPSDRPRAREDADKFALTLPPADPVPPPPEGLPATPAPRENPTTPESVALGELLFFDPRLSSGAGMRCADCHDPELAFADDRARADTAAGIPNRRRSASLTNAGYAKAWFWDGSAGSLEGAIESHWRGQMGADPVAIAEALAAIPTYRAHFDRAAGGDIRPASIAAALASYVRTIRSGASPWDRYERGEEDAVTAEAAAGFRVFAGRGQCAVCHPPPLYTDRDFHHVGAGADESPEDPGRYRVTGRAADRGAFRTPGLRGVADRERFFHDGGAESLEEAVRVMAEGGRDGSGRDLEPAELSETEIDALVAFLEALTPEREPPDPPDLPE